MNRGRVVAVVCALSALWAAAPAHAGVATDEMTSCAKLGPKRPGSATDRTQGDRIASLFRAGGLNTTTESFHMPVWRQHDVNLSIADGVGKGMEFDAQSFSYSGTGHVVAPVVDAGTGQPSDYDGLDVRGKIVLVDNGGAYHRTVQVEQIMARGGIGMIYVSGSPRNLIQTGSVRWGQRPPVSIPTVTVAAGTGAGLRAQLAKGPQKMDLEVQGERVDVTTRNIIGMRKGSTYPDRYIVVAGHYDSWWSGANDNCSAVGTLLSMVAANKDQNPAYSMIYIGWGAEEPGLVGSYTWIWRHQDLIPRIAMNINLEETATATFSGGAPTALPSTTLSFGSTSPAMLALTMGSAAANLVVAPVVAPIVAERALSGGIIATDIEGFYAQGVQGVSTASASPYYHTTGDTFDTVNASDLERVTAYLRDLSRYAQLVPPQGFALREVPTVKVSAPAKAAPGEPVPVTITLTRPTGEPIDGDRVMVLADQRDNWAMTESPAQSIGGGRYTWTLPAGMSDAGITRIRATTSTSIYLANGFTSVDQTEGGLLSAGTVCRSPRIYDLRVGRRLFDNTRVTRLRASVSAGKIRVRRDSKKYKLRLDLRKVRSGSVTLTLTARTSAGEMSQTRVYRTCLPVGYKGPTA